MDRFDSREQNRKKGYKNDSRETRTLDLSTEKAESTVKPAKSIQELIDDEMKLEGAYKKELADATENGKISESRMLLSMAQREELFNVKCGILNKYMNTFSKEFEKYRRSLFNLKAERDEYAETRYKRGIAYGYSSGKKEMQEELSPRINKAERNTKKLRLSLYGMVILEIVTVIILMAFMTV